MLNEYTQIKCNCLIFFWLTKGFWILYWSALPWFSGSYHYVPVSWNFSSCSLFSSLIAAVTSLNAPFKRFPSTMWSGSALNRTPYLSLLVDSVTWRTLSSYINTPKRKKMKLKNSHLWQLWKGYKTRGSCKSQAANFLHGCLCELSNLPTLQEQIHPTNTETILQQKILSSSAAAR